MKTPGSHTSVQSSRAVSPAAGCWHFASWATGFCLEHLELEDYDVETLSQKLVFRP